MRTIGVVTVGRSDYGISLPVLRAIQTEPALSLRLFVAGMHLAPEFGLTVKAIEADGFESHERIEMLLSSDTPAGIAKSMGIGVMGFAQAYGRARPDLLVVLGDRFEMFTAALAALPFTIPVAHIHGGELTQGAIDDALRHALTKLSHLHFVSTEEAARRVRQLGEESWRVVVSGSPSLDNLRAMRLLGREELEAHYGLRLDQPPLLVTFHPVTLEGEQTEWQVGELLEALRAFALPIIFTMTNADTHGRLIAQRIDAFVNSTPQARLIPNLGTQGYFSLMSQAAAMVGNSSSGMIEAPSMALPVVNVGTRQQGRVRAENVIDVGYAHAEIIRGIRRAMVPEFRARLRGLANPYGDGHAAEVIVKRLREVSLSPPLIKKRFVDVPGTATQRVWEQVVSHA